MYEEIFGPKREEMLGGWRRPRNEDPHNFCASLNFVKVIKSGTMRWVGYVARI